MPPTANAVADHTVQDTDGDGSQLVTIDGSASTDAGTIVSYEWFAGNTLVATGASANVSFAVARQTTISMLFYRYLHGFLFPKTMDPFLVDLPATRYE